MAKSKDTKGVPISGKRPRGRPRKLHPIEEPKSRMNEASGVASGMDHGAGGDRGLGKVRGRSEEDEAELLRDVLLGNTADKQEGGQVYTHVAAAVSMRLLSHVVEDVCELRRHLQCVCGVTVSEAVTDVCILHGSWLDIAKAKLCISQLLQQGNMERKEGQGTDNNPDLKEAQGTNSALDLKDRHGTDNTPDLKEGQNTENTPDLKEMQDTDNALDLKEEQGKDNDLGTEAIEAQSVGNISCTKHKRSAHTLVHDMPPAKRHTSSVTRQLTDSTRVKEETTASGDVTVKRSRRTRKPTFSSSEWATPHTSQHRHRGSREREETQGTKCRTVSESVHGSPLRKQSEELLQIDNGSTTDTRTADEEPHQSGQLKQESDDPSETHTLNTGSEPVVAVIKQDVETSQDATDTAVLPDSAEVKHTSVIREGCPTDGSTETTGDNIGTLPQRLNDGEGDTIIPHSNGAEQPTSNREKCGVLSTVCEICGFRSATTQGLINHKGNYHSVVMYECDICFRQFGYKNVRDRHRGNHFHDDGSLKESAHIVHKMALKKQGRIENLSPKLLCGTAGAMDAGNEESNTKEETKVEESLVERLLDWENNEERGDAEPGNTPNNVDCGNDTKEQLQEVNIAEDVAGKNELKPDTLEENMEHSESSVCDGGQTGSQPRLYECDLCGARLTQAYYLKKHYDAVHYSGRARKKTDSVRNQLGRRNDTFYECPHCTFVCYRIQNFTRHVDSHRQPAIHKCQLCSYTNKVRGEVMRHMRNAHGEKKFKCLQCGGVYRTQILLNCHVKQKHEKSRRTVCEICGKLQMTRKSYYKHKEQCHGNETAIGKVMCQTCGRVFNTQRLYDTHWTKCHSEDADNEEEREIGDALQILSNGHFQCRHCLYKNAVAREVRRHIIRVHAEKKFKCDHCSAAFPRQAFLSRHVRIQHQGTERAQCVHCKKYFRHYANLKAHMNRIHLEDKPYQCSVCLRSFFDKRTLVMHMDLHRPEDERDWKFECKPCSRHFRFKCNYEYHMQDHTGQRPHVCATCSKAFKTKAMLETHLAVHSEERPFSCSHCGKRFKLQKYLDVHVLTHYSEKVCCAACGKIFGQPSDLKKHICRAIPTAPTGLEAEATGLGLGTGEVNIEGLSVLGDGTTVTAILVEHQGDDGEHMDECMEVANTDTHMVIEQQALVCETTEGSQLFPLVDATAEETGLDDAAVAMYMCGLCHKLFATQEEINDHMQEHMDVECDGEKLLAQLEDPSVGEDTGDVPAVSIEEVDLDTSGTVAYM